MEGGNDVPTKPIAEHLQELRRRLAVCVLALVAGSVLGYALHEQLLQILAAPLGQQLYYTSPFAGFNALIEIALFFGVLVSLPVWLLQLAGFLSPASQRPWRAKPLRLAGASLLLAAAGIAFGYFICLPAALHFLSEVTGSQLKPFMIVGDYLSFVLIYLVVFALIFQLPLIMLFINRVRPQNPRQLLRGERWVILGSFILAAIITPTPDPLNQVLVAAPMIVLFQLGIAAVWLANRKQRGERESDTAEVARPKLTVAQPPPAAGPHSPHPAPRLHPQPRYFDIVAPQRRAPARPVVLPAESKAA